MQNFWKDSKEYYGIVEKGLFQTTGSAGLIGTNEIRGLDGCWSIAIFQAVFFF